MRDAVYIFKSMFTIENGINSVNVLSNTTQKELCKLQSMEEIIWKHFLALQYNSKHNGNNVRYSNSQKHVS